MKSSHDNHFFNAHIYLDSFAEKLIDYIDKTAGNNVNNLFACEDQNRFLLNDATLVCALRDSRLQEELNKKLIIWKLMVSEENIKITRLTFREYYFTPIAAHPKWQTFLAKHPNISQPIIDKIKAAFFYWMFQSWIETQSDPMIKKCVQSLIAILNSDASDATVCKTFESNLIAELERELSGFFLEFINFKDKKEEISERVKNKLIVLHESHQAQFENIKLILWKRIEGFLEKKMTVTTQKMTAEPTNGAHTPIKKSFSSESTKQIKPDIKNEIAKGMLEYFYHRTTEDERASDKYHITLTNIFNALFLQVSKDKHKKYESLFMYVPKDVKDQQKRIDYSQQRSRPIAQSVSHIKRDIRHIDVDTNQLDNVRRSLKAFTSSPSAKDDSADSNNNGNIQLIAIRKNLKKVSSTSAPSTEDEASTDSAELKEVRFDAKEHVKLVVSPRRVSTHYRRESFFAPPKTAIDAFISEIKETGREIDSAPIQNVKPQ